MLYKIRLSLVMLLLFCLGCSSLDERVDRAYQSVQSDSLGSQTAITAIEVAYSPSGERSINSIARVGGGSPTRIDVDTLKTQKMVSTGRVEMRLKMPDLYGDDEPDSDISSSEWERYGSAAIKALQKTISTFDTLKGKRLLVNLVSSPRDKPIYIASASEAASSEISLVVYAGHPAYPADAARWWAGTTETITHELMHLQHQLSDAVSYEPSVESELAGEVMGKCGYLNYLIEIGVTEVDFEFSKSTIQDEIFPELHGEQFQYDKQKLKRLGNINEIADVLGSAYALHLLGEQPTKLDDLSAVKPLLDYCGSLHEKIPRIQDL